MHLTKILALSRRLSIEKEVDLAAHEQDIVDRLLAVVLSLREQFDEADKVAARALRDNERLRAALHWTAQNCLDNACSRRAMQILATDEQSVPEPEDKQTASEYACKGNPIFADPADCPHYPKCRCAPQYTIGTICADEQGGK